MKHPFKSRQRTKALAVSACLVAVAIPLSYQLFKSTDSHHETDKAASTAGSQPSSLQPGTVRTIAEWQELVDNAEASGLRSLMEDAMRIPDASMRNEVLTSITARWIREDIEGFNKYWFALEVDGDDGKLAMMALALQGALGNLTPELAATDGIYVAVQRLISHLSGTDPDTALAWAKK